MPRTRDPLNAFLDLPDPAVPHAESGPLAGLTLGVKDIYEVAGLPTAGGNPERPGGTEIAAATAPSVQKLLDAGARFAGKTQTDELTFSLMGQNVHYPHPVNPAAPGRVTGGSSSGSAAAVAGGLCDIAAGSDTGGSVRGPASFCGLIGLRPTHGLISLSGAMPLAPSLDTFGWFARDAATYEKVAEILLGDGPDEAPSRPLRLAALDALVLGSEEASEYARMADRVAAVLGAPREAPTLSQSIDDLYWTFRKLQAYEAWAVHGDFVANAGNVDPAVRQRFEFGATLGCEVATAETQTRNAFREELAALLGDDGILVMPTMPGAAPFKDAGGEALLDYRERALRLLCLSGLSGFPQITLPIGTVQGAPFGISLLGPKGSDMALVRIGRRIVDAAGRD